MELLALTVLQQLEIASLHAIKTNTVLHAPNVYCLIVHHDGAQRIHNDMNDILASLSLMQGSRVQPSEEMAIEISRMAKGEMMET